MIRNNWISYVWRSAFVLVSAVVFGVCLTQTAFVSPGAYFDHGYELPLDSMENSAWSQLCFGWLGLPAAVVSLFMPYAFPIVPIVVAFVLFAKEWDIAAAMAALVAVGSMWINHTLALAAWLQTRFLRLPGFSCSSACAAARCSARQWRLDSWWAFCRSTKYHLA